MYNNTNLHNSMHNLNIVKCTQFVDQVKRDNSNMMLCMRSNICESLD